MSNIFATENIKNASMVTLSCTIGILLLRWFPLQVIIWIMLVVALLPLGKFGDSPNKRSINLLAMGVISILFVTITLLFDYFTPYLIIPWLFLSTILLYTLPQYLLGSQINCSLVLIFEIIAYSLPKKNFEIDHQTIIGICLGTFIIVSMNFLFDRNITSQLKSSPNHFPYPFQRALKMALILMLVLAIGHFFNVQNISWVAVTAIVIDQNNLGASMKKAVHRLLGTVLGVIAGILLAYSLFEPYPSTHWVALILIFLTFIFIQVNYAFAIFFATILLAIVFYVFAGNGITIKAFMLNRIIDISLGILIGVIGQLLIFPKSLFEPLRDRFCQFWEDINSWLASNCDKEEHLKKLKLITHSFQIIEQDLKDFRYEPISFIFKRYYLTVSLLPLIKNLLATLTHLSNSSLFDIPQPILISIHQAFKALQSCYKNPYHTSFETLQIALHELILLENQFITNLALRSLLINLQAIVKHYQLIMQTPRWRLELKGLYCYKKNI